MIRPFFSTIAILLLFSGAAEAHPKVGVVVIDVQKSFFASAANANMPAVMANTQKVFELAEQNNTPFFITYEGKKTGDHDIPSELKRRLPKQQKSFIKTTYAATGLKPFVKALKESGLTHLIVLGSETDVCVMHTVLGLRKLGFQVSLQKDAVFSSEHNPSAAYRRMEMAGVGLVGMNEVEKMLASDTPPAPSKKEMDSLFQPIAHGESNLALVLNLFDEGHVKDSGDALKPQKLERIRELLLLSEWMQIPVYVNGANPKELPASLKKTLPPEAARLLEKKKWRPFADFPKDKHRQVFLAGIDQNLTGVIETLGDRQLFLTEDSLLAAPGKNQIESDQKGLIPLTYKSLYYGLTRSISQKEWPVRKWMERDPIFYPLMLPPEELAPMKTIRRIVAQPAIEDTNSQDAK